MIRHPVGVGRGSVQRALAGRPAADRLRVQVLPGERVVGTLIRQITGCTLTQLRVYERHQPVAGADAASSPRPQETTYNAAVGQFPQSGPKDGCFSASSRRLPVS